MDIVSLLGTASPATPTAGTPTGDAPAAGFADLLTAIQAAPPSLIGTPDPPGSPPLTVPVGGVAVAEQMALPQALDALPEATGAEPKSSSDDAPDEATAPDATALETAATMLGLVMMPIPAMPSAVVRTSGAPTNDAPTSLVSDVPSATSADLATSTPAATATPMTTLTAGEKEAVSEDAPDPIAERAPAKAKVSSNTRAAGTGKETPTVVAPSKEISDVKLAGEAVSLSELPTDPSVTATAVVVSDAPVAGRAPAVDRKSSLKVEVATPTEPVAAAKLSTESQTSADTSSEERPARSTKDENGAIEATVADAHDVASAPSTDTAREVKPTAAVRAADRVDGARIDRQHLVRQVADRIELLSAARPREGVLVHLEPNGLGTVTLLVKNVASAVEAQVFASNEDVRSALDQSRPELGAALAQRGFTVHNLTISTAPPAPANPSSGSDPLASQGQGQGQNQSGKHPAPNMPTGGRNADVDYNGLTLEQSRGAIRSKTGVDLWI